MSGVKPTSIKIEMDALDGGAVWVDVSADVRNQNPITAEYGIRSSDISKRVATGGNFSFALDNSLTNASTIRGWYSPDSASTREGFAVGTKTRLQIAYGGSTFSKFVGKIDGIEPVPGKRQEQSTRINVVDWMNAAGRFKVRSTTPILVDKKMNQIIATSLSAITEQPESTSLATGQDTFTYALDSGRSKQTTMLRILQKISESELGYVYVIGNNASGGVLTSENRHTRIQRTTSGASVNDDMVKMKIGRKRKRVKNAIRVRVHPRVVDTTASQLFSLDYVPEVRGGDSIVITGEYTDPTNAQRPIGGASVIPPIPGTDYTINTNSDGSGTDVTYDQKGRVMSSATASNNLIGYWMLGDAAGTTDVKEETDVYRNKYGAACLITFGATGIGDGRTGGTFDGASSYIDVYSSDLNTSFKGSIGTITGWAKVSDPADWSDGTARTILRMGVDNTSNLVAMDKGTTASEIRFIHAGGGSVIALADTSLGAATTSYFHIAMTWSTAASKIYGYLNGAESGSAAIFGEMAGNLAASNVCIGADETTQNGTSWKGEIAHVAVYDEVLTAASILGIYNAGSGGFNVDAELGGFSVEFDITNRETSPAYVTKLDVRGRRVKDFQPITQEAEDTTSQASYGDLELFWDMPFQEDPLVGNDAAEFFLTNLKDPSTDVDRVEFLANSASELMIAMLDTEPGDRVRVQETVTGIDTDFFVNGVRLKIKPPYNIWCTWYVIPADDVAFWAIGEAGFSEIGETTYVTY